MESETPQQPSFISNRPVRILIFGVAVIIVCVVAVGGAITALKTSRSGPISVDVYPNSKLISSSEQAHDTGEVYSTQDSIQQVFDFYNSRIPKDGDKDSVQGCSKIYTDDNKASQELPGHYYVRCVIDNSQLEISQQLMVTINYQLDETTQKSETRFLIERHWGS
jgi:hypothetical protein